MAPTCQVVSAGVYPLKTYIITIITVIYKAKSPEVYLEMVLLRVKCQVEIIINFKKHK